MTDPTKLDRVLAALDTWTGEYDPHTSIALDAARLLRAMARVIDERVDHGDGCPGYVDDDEKCDCGAYEIRARWRVEK